MNLKYCSLYINKFGKYCIKVRSVIKDELKIVKIIDHVDHIKAKSLLVTYGVKEQEAESAILEMEDRGLNHTDFDVTGNIGYMQFTGFSH